jgi:hypothetical protein
MLFHGSPQGIQRNDRQAEHHRRTKMEAEFRAMCAKHGIQIDERLARWAGEPFSGSVTQGVALG